MAEVSDPAPPSSPRPAQIAATNLPLPRTKAEEESAAQLLALIATLIVAVAFAFIPASFAIFVFTVWRPMPRHL